MLKRIWRFFRRPKPPLPFDVYERRRVVHVEYRTRLAARCASRIEAAALARVLAGELDPGGDVLIVPTDEPFAMLMASQNRVLAPAAE